MIKCICVTDFIRMINNNVNNYLIGDVTNIVISYIVPHTFWPHKIDIIHHPEIWITTEDKLKYNENKTNYYREDFANLIKNCRSFLKKHVGDNLLSR